jgi:hypothetical protein
MCLRMLARPTLGKLNHPRPAVLRNAPGASGAGSVNNLVGDRVAAHATVP